MLSRRGFVGAAGLAVAALVGLGLVRRHVKDEMVGRHLPDVPADRLPPRLLRFNQVQNEVRRDKQSTTFVASASCPPSDLEWSELEHDLMQPRYLQAPSGECVLAIPRYVNYDPLAGTVRWAADAMPA